MANIMNFRSGGNFNISDKQPQNNNILYYNGSNSDWEPTVATRSPLNLVDINSTQTISNKTLTSDTISGVLNCTSGTNIGTGSAPLNNIISTYVTTSNFIGSNGQNINLQANIIPNADSTFNIGNSTTRMSTLYTYTTDCKTGIYLPISLSGGNQSLLNYYEQGSFNATISGPFSTTATFPFTIIGNIVCVRFPPVQGTSTSATYFTISGVPARLSPSTNLVFQSRVINNSTVQSTPGNFNILYNSSFWTVYLDGAGDSFSGSGTVGWNSTAFTYILA